MRRALILGAHLDDSIIAMGATIRKMADAGIEVSVFCFGNGDEAYSVPGGQKAAVEHFKASAEKAHKILGAAHLECVDVGDFEVDATPQFYRLCIGAIRKYKPDVLFGHAPAEYFQHHGMSRMSLDAWNQARWICTADYGTEPWAVDRYYQFEVKDLLSPFTHLVDVSEQFEAKMEAMACFEEGGHLGDESDELRARARFYGSRIGVKYAEAFQQNFSIPVKVSEVNALF